MRIKAQLSLILLAALTQMNCGGQEPDPSSRLEEIYANVNHAKAHHATDEYLERVSLCKFTLATICERATECERRVSMDQCVTGFFQHHGITCYDVAALENKNYLNDCPRQLAHSYCSDDWRITAPACYYHFTWIVDGQEIYL